MTTPPPTKPIVIAGGGFIGPLMALALSQKYAPIYLIDPAPLSHQLTHPSDGRAIAITQASKEIFQQLGLWGTLSPHAEPLLTVFTQDDQGTEMRLGEEHAFHQPLGYMVDSKILKDTLLHEAHKNPNITCLTDQVTHIEYHGEFEASVLVALASGEQILATLVIGADGTKSRIRRAGNFRTYEWSYNQTAFVRVYQHSNPHQGQAYEKFLTTGPFAILPLPHNRSSIVWSLEDNQASHVRGLSDSEFDQCAYQHMNEYSNLVPCSPRWERPLRGVWVPFFVAHRLALIGDAAHQIHPLAGQGINLGIQDVAALTKTLEEGLSLGLDLGSHTLLKRYEQAQRWKHLSLLGATHGLNRLFSNDESLLRWIRHRGLSLVEKTPSLKRFFVTHGAGISKPATYPVSFSIE